LGYGVRKEKLPVEVIHISQLLERAYLGN